MIGKAIGPYQILAKLGEGGMGEVYRATDTNLRRSVAIKVLPASVASDADRLARFQREAEVLAALNHPNIAAIYGLEKTPDLTALVMELVEGQDLSELIGALETQGALRIAAQITDALEAAHEQGIVHRDLKPQNIKVRADGTVKVLDFGLAKAMDLGASGAAKATPYTASDSPTMMSPAMTAMGVILGTAAYMSPEQAKGRAVDKRADIWAFGVVLYEMLTGRQLFGGDSIAETIGFVATRDPDWSALPASTPASIRRLLARCLTRDPKHRLRDIGEARIALADPIDDAGASSSAVAPPSGRLNVPTIGLALAAVMMTAVAGYLAFGPAPQPAPIRLEMVDPTGGPVPSMPVVSPDGKIVAYVKGPTATSMIWLRPLAAKTAYPLAGTEGALQPFWSPDGSEVGFTFQGDLPTARRQIRKVPVGGGNAQTLGEVPFATQGTWNQDGVIVVSQAGGTTSEGGLFRIPATGGTPTRINDARTWRWPSFLPDGRQFLFTVVSRDENDSGIYLGALDSTDVTRLSSVVSSAQYADGYVFYVKDQTVVAQAFDLTGRRLTGDPVLVVDDVHFTPPIYLGAFSVAGKTFVAKARSGQALRQLTWMNRSGAITGTVGEPGPFSAPDLSPDGRLVALIRADDAGGPSAAWMVDLERSVFSELRAGTASVRFSSRGERIAYVSLDGIRAAPIGGGAETVLLAAGAVRSGVANFPGSVSDWSPDDRYVTAQVLAAPQIFDVTAPGKPMLIGSRFDVAFSPAGGWMAYRSVVSGSTQSPVFVEPFTGKPPTGAGRIQVSQRGGQRPVWRQDGRELFYVSGGEMMATTVTPGSPPKLGTPRRLFTVPNGATYDVSADGEQFLLAMPMAEVARPPFSVLLNWRALLAAPTSRR